MSETRVTISQLTAGNTPDGTEEFPAFQGAATVKLTVNDSRRLHRNPTPVIAAGTDQSGATLLSNTYWCHTMGTVPANSGIRFAPLTVYVDDEPRYITNPLATGNNVNVYPPSGGRINDESINAAVQIEPGVTGHFIRVSALDLRSIG